MKYINRAFLSVMRSLRKNILLFIIMTLMGLFITSSIVLSSAATSVQQQFVEKTGFLVTLVNGIQDDITNINAYTGVRTKNRLTEYRIYRYLFDELLDNNEMLQKADYTIYAFHHTRVLENRDSDVLSSRNYEDMVIFPGMIYDDSINQVLWGVETADYPDLFNHWISIIEGENFTDQQLENGEMVCLVNEDLMIWDNGVKREIRTGELIPITLRHARNTLNNETGEWDNEKVEKEIYLKVIGKFHKIVSMSRKTFMEDMSMDIEDRIYVPNKAMLQITDDYLSWGEENGFPYTDLLESLYCMSIPGITDPLFKLKSPDDYMPFSARLMNLSNVDPIDYYTSSDAFEKVAGTLTSVEDFSRVLLIATMVSFTFVLILTVYLALKNRRKEIGILLSMGEKKGRILSQFILEILIIGLAAYVISTTVSFFITKPVSEQLVKNTMEAQSYTNQTDDEGNLISAISSMNEADLAEMFEVHLETEQFVRILLLEMAVLITGSLVSITFAVNSSPKKDLLG